MTRSLKQGVFQQAAMARMRGIKAEGGWGAVCTEQCDVHYSSCHPRELRLWDERDLPILIPVVEQIHAGDALAGIELAHNGFHVHNLETRSIPLAPTAVPTRGGAPVHARTMDLDDIRAVRRWHRQAALNARRAGFDIVYIYAGHDMTLPAHFLSRRHNQRTDEYGGSLENRARLLRELLIDTKEAVGDRCAVALRLSVADAYSANEDSEAHDVVALLADLPDLWDVNISDFSSDGQTSRFADEGYQEDYIRFVKTVTNKPVVGVGRYTSPDRMLSLIQSGVLDLIGAARPSIADPFLPQKIAAGAFENIRECVGCNFCVASDKLGVPIRCTQNPTIGEEWRRGWHPEIIAPRDTDDRVLVIGAGPAGLEAATWLSRRGYPTVLAERERVLGGRAVLESTLPGLAAWRRVADWRLQQLRADPNVVLLLGNDIVASDALDADFTLVAVAVGADWRNDGTGRTHSLPLPGLDALPVFTPNDIMAGRLPQGRVVVFDDDHYYMGGVVAERLAAFGCEVVFVTPESLVSAWTVNTVEQPRIQKRLLECCTDLLVSTKLVQLERGGVELACIFTGARRRFEANAVVLVTAQKPRETLYRELIAKTKGPRIVRIGDCLAPGSIAAAVYSGHLFARTLDSALADRPPFRRENVAPDWNQPLAIARQIQGSSTCRI